MSSSDYSAVTVSESVSVSGQGRRRTGPAQSCNPVSCGGEDGQDKMGRARTNYVPYMLHAMCIGSGLSIAACFLDGTLFGYHPTLMGIGFVLLMAEGVMASVSFRDMEAGPNRVDAIWRHLYVQVAAVLAVAGGFYAIYHNKDLMGKDHFTTDHSKVGLAAIVISFTSALGGAGAFKRLGLLERIPEQFQAPAKLAHRKVGLVALCLGLAAAVLGIRYPKHSMGAFTYLWQFAIMCVGLTLAYVSSVPSGPRLLAGCPPWSTAKPEEGESDPMLPE